MMMRHISLLDDHKIPTTLLQTVHRKPWTGVANGHFSCLTRWNRGLCQAAPLSFLVVIPPKSGLLGEPGKSSPSSS